jgi:hypothetical protein
MVSRVHDVVDGTRFGSRLLWRLARNPVEGAVHLREHVGERRIRWRVSCAYEVETEWESRYHEELLGTRWPCHEEAAFASRWEDGLATVRKRGLRPGRGSYGGWDDADPALARTAWCLVRHLRPARVVETGVARGMTSRIILEALNENGDGGLWSVDLPPALSPALRRQTGSAVPDPLRSRWRYIRGSSRRRLPGLVRELGEIDVFLHDSMHTTRNVLFELEAVWPTMRSGGVVLVDDVDLSRGLELFTRAHDGELVTVTGRSDDGERVLSVIQKRV